MKAHKEITIAVIIGLVFGLVVVGGVLRAKKAIDASRTANPQETSRPTSSPTPQDLVLELTTPDNQVLEEGVLTISGKTNPEGFVVILGEKGEFIVTPGQTGAFSQEITLVKGANTIKITVYLENGASTSKSLTAVYSSGSI